MRDRIVTGFVLAVRVSPGSPAQAVELPLGTRLTLEDRENHTALIQIGSEWYRCHLDELLDGSRVIPL